jgi:PAS domain S-box-containing protein
MKQKLLILDDEALILRSLENLFEDEYEVFTTGDADEALKLAQEHDMAVIVSDERMPGIGGHEFLRRARGVSSATRILMSGYADIGVLTQAVNDGQIFAFTAKPWEPLKLSALVASAVVHFNLVREVEHERGLLRALMENIPDLIYFKDGQSRFTRVNNAHARNLGARDADECIGKSNADYFEPEYALPWRLEEEEILRSGRPQVDRIQPVMNYRGGVGWWSTTKVPMFDRNGQVTGIAGISRNITGLKKSESMLREQSERNRMILEAAYDAFIGMDSDGAITAWNPRAEVSFGWSAAEVMGLRWSDIVIPLEYRHLHAHGMESFLADAKGVNRRIELVVSHRNGREFPAEVTIWPVRTGDTWSFNALLHDISEQRRAEDARRKEMTLVELLQSVTVAANRSSVLSDTARICLDRICTYTGWPVGHAYLRASNSSNEPVWAEIWHDGGDGRFAAFREASDRVLALREQESPNYVLRYCKPRWIVNLADEEPSSDRTIAAEQAGLRSGFRFPVFVKDEIIGVLEFISFNTVPPDEELLTIMGHIGLQLGQVVIRQRAEAELQRAKSSAESANRAKGEFLTTMSHEMRTPMNAILGMADMLSESSLDEKQRDYVCIFQNAGASLLDLINDILDLSKVESGQVKLESIAFDLADFLQRIVEMMAPRAQGRGLELRLEFQPEVPVQLVGDSSRLRQILINLVGNALKFTERGSVTLRVEPDPEAGAEWLRFSVVDTGIGIASDQTELIFERFAQADSSTTRKYGGSGLGLAISKGLVELMGGRIGCTSDVGKGSTFFVAVPLGIWNETEIPEAIKPSPTAIVPVRQVGQGPVYRILIAEDSEFNILLLRAFLQDSGFELDVAVNGRIAVEKVHSGRPDLVIMDMQMPVMDGLDATRAIRQWEAETQASPIPIIALTAHAAQEAAARSREAGCTEHFTKPIRKAILLEAIARHLGGIRITPPKGIEFLIPEYLASVRREMGEILTGLDSKDCEIARRLGHQFKGSGAGYGFPQIARTGAAVELAAMAFNGDEVRNQIRALTRYLDRVEIAA